MYIHEYNCPECKRDFIPAAQHIYKIHGKTYCSYTCWRKNGGGQPKPIKMDVEDDTKLKNYHKKANKIIKEFVIKSCS